VPTFTTSLQIAGVDLDAEVRFTYHRGSGNPYDHENYDPPAIEIDKISTWVDTIDGKKLLDLSLLLDNTEVFKELEKEAAPGKEDRMSKFKVKTIGSEEFNMEVEYPDIGEIVDRLRKQKNHNDADLSLIAAAPDMLEALEYECSNCGADKCDPEACLDCGTSSAIAKAKGGSDE
jgi:hypothetical protein